jgi:hypothetical protein
MAWQPKTPGIVPVARVDPARPNMAFVQGALSSSPRAGEDQQMADATSRYWLRDRKKNESAEVTYVELFFDLVFVFTVTQLSHYLE